MPVLAAIDIKKRFGVVAALAETSIDVAANEIHGLIGPNGSGQPTLLHVIAGRPAPDAGVVLLEGHDSTSDLPSQRARKGLAIKCQVARVYREQTVAENLLLALQAREGLTALMLSRSRRKLMPPLQRLLDDFGLTD